MVKRIAAAVLLAILPTLVFASGRKESPSNTNHNAPVKTSDKREDRFLLQGQVIDENGNPVPGADVVAIPDSLQGKLPMSTTDQQGRFSIPVYKTGRWRISAKKYSQGYPTMSLQFYYPNEKAVPEVILNEKDPPPFVTVRFGPRAGKLSGRIVNEATGEPIQNAQIGLCRVDAPRFCYRQNIVALNGQYEVLVPSAPILVQISADGYEDWYVADDTGRPKPLEVTSNVATELNVFLKKGDHSSSSLEAPQLVSPVDGMEFFHYPRLTRLDWLAVPAAGSYTVEVEFCSGGSPPPTTCKDPHPLLGSDSPPTFGIKGTSYEFSFLGSQPGRWRVWAIDAEGRPGTKSAWSMFFYRR